MDLPQPKKMSTRRESRQSSARQTRRYHRQAQDVKRILAMLAVKPQQEKPHAHS